MPYNIYMKNTKAILLIVLGSFIIATGFAFAENVSYGQLEEYSKGITIPVSGLTVGTNKEAILKGAPVTAAAAPVVATAPVVPAPTAAAAPAKPAPTFMESAKKYVGDNMDQIVSATAIGFIAFLVLGTGGLGLLVGLLAFSLFQFIK